MTPVYHVAVRADKSAKIYVLIVVITSPLKIKLVPTGDRTLPPCAGGGGGGKREASKKQNTNTITSMLQRENSNSKTLFYKDCSIGSVKKPV